MSDKYVYVITDGECFKIGVSNDPESRLKTLQTGNKNTLELVYKEVKKHPFKVEKYLHRQLHKNHAGGEWYTNITLHDIRVQLILCTEYD